MDIQSLLCTPKTPRIEYIYEVPDSQASNDSLSPSPSHSPVSLSQASTQSWDSQNGPRPPQTPIRRVYAPLTTRSDRIRIKTALEFGHNPREIHSKLGYTLRQIQHAKDHRNTPQQHKRGRQKPAIDTPKRQRLEQWLLASPSHRRTAYKHIPRMIPELEPFGDIAIRTAFKLVGYGRRTAKRKGFSDDPKVWQERLDFANEAIYWPFERVLLQIFSDEVWAFGGAHTQSYISCKIDGSDRYSPECLTHRYSKRPAWMFHDTIARGKKGPAVFWEKEWGSMDSAKYDAIILNNIQMFVQIEELRGIQLVWMQDNASCHRSKATYTNLDRRGIRYIKFPRYSPDLNLIEHVWNWMKNWIQAHYYAAYYDAAKIPFRELRRIIWEAWEAVPEDYIMRLYNSWYRRCQAVIDARGGPTKY